MRRSAERPGPRRVLLVINSLARGGAETQLLGVARALQQAGDEVVVATLRGGNDFAEQVERDGLQVWLPAYAVDSWSPRRLIGLMVRIIRWRPQVTVSFLLQATLFMRMVNLVARPDRAIASMRNEKLETPLRERIYRATCGADDVVVVNSAAACTALQTSGTIPSDPRRVAVVYNGVDALGIRGRARADPASTRERLGVAPEETMVLGVGRLSTQKDWGTLVDAVALVGSGVRCFVAGEGPLAEDLRARARRQGVADRFTFLGLRSDIPDLLAAADCLALSSRHEGTPNVVLEAMAMGTPVVATDVGACRELVSADVGEVVPVGDATALAAALGRCEQRDLSLTDPVVVDRFAWDVVGPQWADLVHGVARPAATPLERSVPPADR